jgi:hypothetical protein
MPAYTGKSSADLAQDLHAPRDFANQRVCFGAEFLPDVLESSCTIIFAQHLAERALQLCNLEQSWNGRPSLLRDELMFAAHNLFFELMIRRQGRWCLRAEKTARMSSIRCLFIADENMTYLDVESRIGNWEFSRSAARYWTASRVSPRGV